MFYSCSKWLRLFSKLNQSARYKKECRMKYRGKGGSLSFSRESIDFNLPTCTPIGYNEKRYFIKRELEPFKKNFPTSLRINSRWFVRVLLKLRGELPILSQCLAWARSRGICISGECTRNAWKMKRTWNVERESINVKCVFYISKFIVFGSFWTGCKY